MMALPTTKNGSMNYRSNLLHFVGLYCTIEEYVKVGHNIHMKATPFWRLYRAYDEDDALPETQVEIQADDPIKQAEDEQINDVSKDAGIIVVAYLIVPISPIEPILRTPTSKSIENNIKNNMCSVKTRSAQFEAPTWDTLTNDENANTGKEMKPSGCLSPPDPITEEIDCDSYVMKKVARKCLEKNIVLFETFVSPIFYEDGNKSLKNFINSEYSGMVRKDSSNNSKGCKVPNHKQGNHSIGD
ncbi:hypothetical protein D8674_030997 [Pyrus ussuriensis x Pyrus communis]|uniref:Uncharacterized protein n=1 Tax=Pyrus ussuriensis x Pyrus communis TaxID=2448454 RepID=A0A5N5EXV2_9ROSA|nr:hypothetical protein D8674_030997 [Pyrus ussuriensis x Pyrus communis]